MAQETLLRGDHDIDLSGKDVILKLVILARRASYCLNRRCEKNLAPDKLL